MRLPLSIVWALVMSVAVGCTLGPGKPDNAAAIADIRAGRSGDEVVVEGTVTHVGRSTSGESGSHEHFDIAIASADGRESIFVADNTTIGTRAPVRRGDDVIVKGVLEIDPQGPMIHWTHHDPAGRHESGYVIVGGHMYD